MDGDGGGEAQVSGFVVFLVVRIVHCILLTLVEAKKELEQTKKELEQTKKKLERSKT